MALLFFFGLILILAAVYGNPGIPSLLFLSVFSLLFCSEEISGLVWDGDFCGGGWWVFFLSRTSKFMSFSLNNVKNPPACLCLCTKAFFS